MSSSVEQIKSRLSIADVVQSYLKLQKAGINFKTLCPFHSEKTPSFFVSPSRDSWHCFGCNRGGDIFSFVMEIEGVDFPEALRILANRAGIELKPVSMEYRNERTRLLQLLEDSKEFYESELKKNQDVISYLKGRGLEGKTVKLFGIGFAPDGWRNLYDFLKSKGYSDSEIEKAGMVVKSDKGYYDRFRSRIMFPLFSSLGQIVGFSGRIFGEESEATGGKYINTPQTILYDKSKILYGFDRAKIEIRKKDFCILVEGQMDVIMSYQAGIINTVAVSGTALTSEHLKIIKRLTNNLVMAFDKDEAGVIASKAGINLSFAQGFEVKVAIVPSGKDPADTIKESPEKWKNALKNSKHIIQFYLDSLTNRKEIEHLVLPYIFVIPNEIDKACWVKEVAKKLFINEEPVWEELKKLKYLQSEVQPPTKSEVKPPQIMSRYQLLKDRLRGFLLWQKNTDDKELEKEIKEIIKRHNLDLGEEKEKAVSIVFEAESFYNNSKDLLMEFKNLVLEFEREKIKNQLEEISSKINRTETEHDESEYLNQFHELSKKLNELSDANIQINANDTNKKY